MASPVCDVKPSILRDVLPRAEGGNTASSKPRVRFNSDTELPEPTNTATERGSNTKCISTITNEHYVSSWMADTGASVDAVSIDLLSERKLKSATKLDDPQTYLTAGGPVTVDSAVTLHSKALNGKVEAQLLTDTPSVISMRRRCIDQMYGF